ncbi:hypothetical protein [Rhizobium sp. 18065]|uniref:hypothetical protein n=1 Tax=Rhizobium sp. 18065 TaxID=2681411 RepID=UPI00135A93B5|nr:hypothetical protein [Rhizobium sp. 18065]
MGRMFLLSSTIALSVPLTVACQEDSGSFPSAEDLQRIVDDNRNELVESGQTDERGCYSLDSWRYSDFVPLTKAELASIQVSEDARDSYFLKREIGFDMEAVCQSFIDLSPAEECGLLTPPEGDVEDAVDSFEVKADIGPGSIIDRMELLELRADQYPPLLKAAGKWSTEIGMLYERIEGGLKKAKGILEGDRSLVEKQMLLSPVFKDVAFASKKIAQAAHVNFSWNSGCGAQEDDSQLVNFSITPKAVIARYILDSDFDRCKALVSDPYDINKCDLWHVMLPEENYMSGSYRYQVVWDDGFYQRDTMSFDSIQEKPREVLIER